MGWDHGACCARAKADASDQTTAVEIESDSCADYSYKEIGEAINDIKNTGEDITSALSCVAQSRPARCPGSSDAL